MAYATRADLYTYGLPRGTIGSVGRLLASASAATETFELDEHGFSDGDPLIFRAVEGAVLPAPLVAGTTYYALRVDDSRFRVSATVGGAAVNLTTTEGGIIVATPLPIDELLELYSRWVDGFVPAHAVPLEAPFPVEIVAAVAMLTAARLQTMSGVKSVSMAETEASAKEQLKRWATGIPIRDVRVTTTPTNLAVTAARSTTLGYGNGSIP